MRISSQNLLQLLQKYRAIAVIRTSQLELGHKMAHAVAVGGIQLIEITWDSDRPAELIQQLSAELPECKIGTGTLLNRQQLQAAITAGAKFLFSPHVDPTMIQSAVEQGVPIIPGGLSPTEIVTAWQAGASCVKVFPVQAMGGVHYIKSLQGPLGNIPLIPTGGVTVENAKEFITAGAVAVGLSSDLFPTQLINTGNWEAISQRTHNFIHQLMDDAN